MKLIDGITAFFTTGFDKFISWFGVLKRGLEHIVSSRLAVVTMITASVKLFYDKTVEGLNSVLEQFGSVNSAGDPSTATSGLSSALEFGNTIFPISETLQVFILLLNLWIIVLVIRLKMKFLPKLFW